MYILKITALVAGTSSINKKKQTNDDRQPVMFSMSDKNQSNEIIFISILISILILIIAIIIASIVNKHVILASYLDYIHTLIK